MGGLQLFIAHPDDEVFCSGLVCKVAEAGVPVHIVCLTAGEGGRLGSPEIATRDTIAEIRRDEMRRSAAVLGVADVSFLGYVDPEPVGVTLRAPDHNPETLRADIAAEIDRRTPAVVLTHGPTGEYGHPAHILLHNMLRDTLRDTLREAPRRRDRDVEFYTFRAFVPSVAAWSSPRRDDWVTFTFDSTPLRARRVDALWQHKTQYSVFVGYQDSEHEYRGAITEYIRKGSLERYSRWPRPDVPARRRDPLMEWAGVESTDGKVIANTAARALFGFLWSVRPALKAIRQVIPGRVIGQRNPPT